MRILLFFTPSIGLGLNLIFSRCGCKYISAQLVNLVLRVDFGRCRELSVEESQ